MMIGGCIVIVLFLTVLLFASKNKELNKTKYNLQNKISLIERQKDSLQNLNKNIARLSDSIFRANIILRNSEDSLTIQAQLLERLLAVVASNKDSIENQNKKLQLAYTEINTYKTALEKVVVPRSDSIITEPLMFDKNSEPNGQTGYGILTKTILVKSNKTVKYKFSTRGKQELGVIAEPGGKITLRIHVTNTDGLDKWYTKIEGKQSQRISFETPRNKRNVVELEIFNCVNKNISCVIISN